MNISKEIIDATAKLLLDNQLWSDCKYFVADVESHDLTGAEKHAKVIKDLKFIFGDIEHVFLNLAIELAKVYMKAILI
jgi:hypothetical protein